MLKQLQIPVPLHTPKGKAWAIAVIDNGPRQDLLWMTLVRDTGECWTFHNEEIRQECHDAFGCIPTADDEIDYRETRGSRKLHSAHI